MTLASRPSSPADAIEIAALCARLLPVPAGSPVFSFEHMRWKYWDPWPSWQGPRSFLLFEGEELVAHAGIVPLPFSRDGRAHTLVQLIDWAADPRHVGAGTVLLKRIAALADGVVSVRGSTMTQRILKPLGFRSFGESLQYAAPVISSAGPFRSQLAAAATLRIHRRGYFTAGEHPLSRADSSDARIVLQRSAAQIEAWAACPIAPMHYGEVMLGDHLLGSFLLCQTPGQARIVDLWADEHVERAWEAVVELAYRHGCEQAGATEVVCQSNDPAQGRALEAAGFAVAGSDPLAILASSALIPNTASFRHHLVDSDLAYLHHGELLSWLK